MKSFTRFIISIALIFVFFLNGLPCGPGYITPIFEYKHAPENPFENFAGGRIGILKPSYRRVVLFAAYRYLNGGGFTADEQKGLTDVWKAEFNNRDYQDNDVSEAVKAWIEKRKDVLPKEEKLPEIYTEREYGSYDFFPNCTKNAFETAAQTLSDRTTSYGADNKDVKDWLTAQDQVFTNCSSGKQTPDAPNQTMPEWLQKDRAYQLAAADFYSLDYENARRQFAEIAQDSQSVWQETADYLVARTLIRQASLTDNEAKANPLYIEAEERLQSLVAKGGKFGDSSIRLLGLVKYRLYPQERVGELGRKLSVQSGNQSFRQDLIDYNWLLDRFAKETLEKEEKRKEELKPQDTNASSSVNKMSNSSDNANANLSSPDNTNSEGLLKVYFYTDDYSKNWTISVAPDATDDEAIAEAEKAVGAPLTDKMKEVVRNARQTAYASRFSSSSASEYKGGYYGAEEMSLSILPDFLRRDDLTDWLFTFQIENTESYLYALSKFRQSN
ncbi:MAG: hypothetical protein M3Q33_11515, partial [Acidobacteriota bacterium]|nr:hypothetical protein [Acidobacteriota bacterium]